MTQTSITPPYDTSFARGAEKIYGVSSDQFTLERNTLLRSLVSFYTNQLNQPDTYHRKWSDGKQMTYFQGWCVAMQQEIIQSDLHPWILPDSKRYDQRRVAVHQDAGLITNLAERYVMGNRQFPIASKAAFEFREMALKFYQQRLLVSEANALNATISRRAIKEGFKNAIHPWKLAKRQGVSFVLRQFAHINPIVSIGAPLAARGITRATYEATALIQGREVFDGRQWWRIKMDSEENDNLKEAYRKCYEACIQDQALIDTGNGIRNIGYDPDSINLLMESILILQPIRKFCGIYQPIMAYELFRHALEPKKRLTPHRASPRRIGKK